MSETYHQGQSTKFYVQSLRHTLEGLILQLTSDEAGENGPVQCTASLALFDGLLTALWRRIPIRVTPSDYGPVREIEFTRPDAHPVQVIAGALLRVEVANQNPIPVGVANRMPISVGLANTDPLPVNVANPRPIPVGVANPHPIGVRVAQPDAISVNVANPEPIPVAATAALPVKPDPKPDPDLDSAFPAAIVRDEVKGALQVEELPDGRTVYVRR